MSAIKGQKYQLAGFDISQKGTLVQVFAKFCGADQDPANLPETRTVKMFANSEPQEMRAIYPRLSQQDIVNALIGADDISAPVDHIRLPPSPEELMADLGEDQFSRILVEMGKAKKAYLNREEPITTFLPYTP
jgi:hypothetical protein